MTQAGANAADAMAKFDSVRAACALDWPVVDGEGNCIALGQRHHLHAALHARTLLGHAELTTGEVLFRLRQQDRNLYREHEISVEVLMEAVEISRHVLQQE